MRYKILLLCTIMGLISGCNGGGAGSDTTGNTPGGTTNTVAAYGTGTNISGVLLDAPMSGVSYTSTSNSGKTTSNGGYTCKDGEVVSFSLASISIGSVVCKSVVTPVELVTSGQKTYQDAASLTTGESDKVNKMLVILQMMDHDGDPSNGIVVDANNLYGLEVTATNSSKFDLKEIVSDNTVFSSFKSGLIDAVRTNSNANYYSGNTEPTETTARAHFDTTLGSVSNCSTSNVENSATVTGVNGVCTALSCQPGSSLNDQGLCIVNKTCADVHQIGVESFSGTYPNCVPATCSTNFALNNGSCQSTISNDYYCLQGTLHSAALSSDILGEFPSDSLTTMQNNSLKYNFVNPTTGDKAGRQYASVSALFILRNGQLGSELRKKNANAVVSIPVGFWGKEANSNMLVVSAVHFNNPSNLIGTPLKDRYFEWFLPSIYSDVISMATSGSTIAIDKRNDGYLTSQSVTASSLNWTFSRNCSLTGWAVNY